VGSLQSAATTPEYCRDNIPISLDGYGRDVGDFLTSRAIDKTFLDVVDKRAIRTLVKIQSVGCQGKRQTRPVMEHRFVVSFA